MVPEERGIVEPQIVGLRSGCRVLFETILQQQFQKWAEGARTKSQISRLSCDIYKFRKNNIDVLKCLLKLEGGWPIAKSTRNIIPILVAVSRHIIQTEYVLHQSHLALEITARA